MLSLVSYFLIFNIILNHKCIILCLNYSFPTKYPEKLSVNWWTSKDNVTGERSAENDLSVNEDEVSKLSFSEFPSKQLKDYVDSSVFKQYEQLEKMEEPKYWSRFQRKMKENLIPSVLKDVPDQETEVIFHPLVYNEKLKIFQKKKVIVDLGNHVIPSLAKQPPYLNWFDDWNKYYSVMMIDPDAPTIEHPIHRHWLHWLVVNSKGDKVHKGDIVAEYVGPCPQRGTETLLFVKILIIWNLQKNTN
ncbi:uncharacterized protein LOC142324552 isoform X3 [Lycorma delicatula]|uniref:uncharacterized protein LOC142324552 isoform X3 n=1 Tax=Lycorma delicatula TaxID=130591 RepID=UPI003F5108A1